MQIEGLSDVGLRRSDNEDSIGFDRDLRIAVLADGMGGHACGNIASRLAVDTVLEVCRSEARQALSGNERFENPRSLLELATQTANERVYQAAKEKPRCRGMGTTLVAGVFLNERVAIANVGDSRLYRLRNGQLTQITLDHTLANELHALGISQDGDLSLDSIAHVLTRAIGLETSIAVDFFEDILLPEDIFLFCSDGLHGLVSDDAIHAALTKTPSLLPKTVHHLIQLANDAGGRDNISVILARADEHTGNLKLDLNL